MKIRNEFGQSGNKLVLILIINLLMLFIINYKLLAQDLKVQRFYDNKEYCKCIKRSEKLLSKKKDPELLYYKAASLIQLYKNNDKSCKIPNLLKKSILALHRLAKINGKENNLRIKDLEKEVVGTYVALYQDDIRQKRWRKAISTMDILIAYKSEYNYYIDRAFCKYELLDPNAINSISSAIRMMLIDTQTDTIDEFTRLFEIIKLLESSNRAREFNQMMDTLIHYFPDDKMLANELRISLLKKWYKYKFENNYDSLLVYSSYLKKNYPEDSILRLQISKAVITIADSLADDYIRADTNISSLLSCMDFLLQTRAILGSYISDLQQSKFFFIEPNKTIQIQVNSTGSSDIGFTIKNMGRNYYYLPVEHIKQFVPCKEIAEIHGYIWTDAPKSRQAKSAKDLLKKETLNYFLLDTLTHAYCNKFRRENKKAELEWNNTYYRGSKHHARVMASRNSIWHGEDLDPFYADLDSIKMYLSIFAGENVQFKPVGDQAITYDEYASTIIEQWKSSPGHRKNMLQNYSLESVSTVIISSDNINAVLSNDKILVKFLPEYKKFFEIFPGFRDDWKKLANRSEHPYSFSSQNFPYVGR